MAMADSAGPAPQERLQVMVVGLGMVGIGERGLMSGDGIADANSFHREDVDIGHGGEILHQDMRRRTNSSLQPGWLDW